MVDTIALFLTLACAFAIVIVLIYVYKQVQNTRLFVQNELKKLAKAVNHAQLNEFKHDKQTEQNIVAIDAKIEKIKDTLAEIEKKQARRR